MDERVIRFRVGVVLLAAATITVILIMLLGAWPNVFQRKYTVYIRFPEAPGVTVDTPIRKSGIEIGRVADVELQDDGLVLLTLEIDRKFTLRRNEICRISTGSLVTGDAVLEFVRSPDVTDTQVINDGDYLANGIVAGDPLQVLVNIEGDMRSAIGSIESAGTQVSTLAQNLNTLLDDNNERIRSILVQTETAMGSFQKAMVGMDQLFGDPQLATDVKAALADLKRLFAEADTTLAKTRQTLEGFERVSLRAEQNLANLSEFTGPLAERGPELAASLSNSVRNVDDLTTQLVEISRAINSRRGSLGELIHNPELYDRINRAAGNIEDVSRKLEPIVNDIRVFSDKIARDPRILGAKGALDRRPSGAGLKFPFD